MKDKILLTSFLILLISLVLLSTITYLNINKSENGKFIYDTTYSDIVINNIEIKDDIIVKIKENTLNVNIPHLTQTNSITFSVYLNNIGNATSIIEGVYIDNIESQLNSKDVIIETSLVKGDIINKKETKQLIVTIKYTGKEKNVDDKFIFNLNYLFNEVKV